jgi:hypothetical protein
MILRKDFSQWISMEISLRRIGEMVVRKKLYEKPVAILGTGIDGIKCLYELERWGGRIAIS